MGRPRTDSVPQHMMLPGELSAAIDAWIERQKTPRPSRPEAIRRLIARGLGLHLAKADGAGAAPTRRKPASKPAAAKAAALLGAKLAARAKAPAAASKRPTRRPL